jgi:hypothetical protein
MVRGLYIYFIGNSSISVELICPNNNLDSSISSEEIGPKLSTSCIVIAKSSKSELGVITGDFLNPYPKVEYLKLFVILS